jgi:hypothetical protein
VPRSLAGLDRQLEDGSQLWKFKFSRKGCSNWNDILVATYLDVTLTTCWSKCWGSDDCYYANYQPTACEGSQQKAAGTCYLFGDGCDKADNACWDLYAFGGDRLLAEASTAPLLL